MMDYIHLSKLYYKDEILWKKEYEQRFNSYGTKHFGIEIKQFGRNKGYEAFLYYTDEIINLIQKIYSLQCELAFIKYSLPDVVQQQYILQCIAEEIKSTNDIEGVRSTRREIRAWLERLPEQEKSPHLGSIIEKYSAISDGKEIDFSDCKAIRNFYDSFVLQEVLNDDKDNAPDGKFFRLGQVEIQGNAIGKIIHRGIFPEEKIIEYMTKALDILHNDDLSQIIRIAVFHYLFAYIHPFYDGNGRMSRFMSSYYLAKEFDVCIALRLSVIIKKHKNVYYKQFLEADSEINRGDLTPFCIYFLGVVKEAFEETLSMLKRKNQQLEKYKGLIKEMNLTNKEEAVYDSLLEAALFYGMGLTVKQLMNITGHSRVTVQKLLDNIPAERLLVMKNVKPYRYKLNLMYFHS